MLRACAATTLPRARATTAPARPQAATALPPRWTLPAPLHTRTLPAPQGDGSRRGPRVTPPPREHPCLAPAWRQPAEAAASLLAGWRRMARAPRMCAAVVGCVARAVRHRAPAATVPLRRHTAYVRRHTGAGPPVTKALKRAVGAAGLLRSCMMRSAAVRQRAPPPTRAARRMRAARCGCSAWRRTRGLAPAPGAPSLQRGGRTEPGSWFHVGPQHFMSLGGVFGAWPSQLVPLVSTMLHLSLTAGFILCWMSPRRLSTPVIFRCATLCGSAGAPWALQQKASTAGKERLGLTVQQNHVLRTGNQTEYLHQSSARPAKVNRCQQCCFLRKHSRTLLMLQCARALRHVAPATRALARERGKQ